MPSRGRTGRKSPCSRSRPLLWVNSHPWRGRCGRGRAYGPMSRARHRSLPAGMGAKRAPEAVRSRATALRWPSPWRAAANRANHAGGEGGKSAEPRPPSLRRAEYARCWGPRRTCCGPSPADIGTPGTKHVRLAPVRTRSQSSVARARPARKLARGASARDDVDARHTVTLLTREPRSGCEQSPRNLDRRCELSCIEMTAAEW